MKNKTFTIKCTMNERWVDSFCSMLCEMERYGRIGHSAVVGMYSDGDGDFRPLAWVGILWVAYHLTKYLEKTNDK